MRPARLIVLLALLAALAGCDSDSGSDAAERPVTSKQEGVQSRSGVLIRDWLQALERSDYGRAAMFFAPGALVDQGEPYRLRTRAAARVFNATLPCRADLVKVKDEGRKVLASFRLRAGPGGPCQGVVKVRFSFEDGRFTEFVQLPGPGEQPEREPRPGETV